MTRPTGRITRTCEKCGIQVDFPDSPLGAAMVDAFEAEHKGHDPVPTVEEIAAEPEACPDCGGSGEVWHDADGASAYPCGRCDGEGVIS